MAVDVSPDATSLPTCSSPYAAAKSSRRDAAAVGMAVDVSPDATSLPACADPYVPAKSSRRDAAAVGMAVDVIPVAVSGPACALRVAATGAGADALSAKLTRGRAAAGAGGSAGAATSADMPWLLLALHPASPFARARLLHARNAPTSGAWCATCAPPLRPLGARACETVLAPVLAHACACTQCYPAETSRAEASGWILRREIRADLRSLAPPRAGARWESEAARAESGTARADLCVLMAGSSPSARARVRIRLRFDQCCKQVLSTLRSATVAIGVIVFILCAYVHVRSCPAARARAATRHARAQGTTRACIQCAIAFTGPSTVSIICCSPVASPATTSAMSP